MPEFDYQWANLPSPNTTHTPERVSEFLKLVKLPREFFRGKKCLDAGCGNGRWTYAMQELGAQVDSFDISPEACAEARWVNKNTYVRDISSLCPNPIYDFVLCWGVLHHLEFPLAGFVNVASQVKSGGILHVMVYHKDTQKIYKFGREHWQSWDETQRLHYCDEMVQKFGGDLHGWWDAFNPTYNWSYSPREIKTWFEHLGFQKVRLTKRYSINMRGVKS